MHSFPSKFPKLGESIFPRMTRLAQEQNALNLGQGFPDFPPDGDLLDRASYYLESGPHQYAPMPGILPLREFLANYLQELYSAEREICITAGATQAIAAIMGTVVRPGDEVLLLAPAYDCYAPMVEMNGGKAVFSNLKPQSFQLDWDDLEAKVSSRTKMLVLNSPHNPSGMLLSEEDLEKLAAFCSKHHLYLLSDEAYRDIVFDGAEHLMPAVHPDLRERTFTVGSFGKSLHITGWKMGYCAAAETLMAEFKKVQQFMIFSIQHPLQYALNDYLRAHPDFSPSRLYQRKRDLFLNALKGSRFSWTPAASSFFQLLDFSQISDLNDVAFAEELCREHKVTAIPVSSLYPTEVDSSLIRLCFAKSDDTLLKAAEYLRLV